MSYKYKLDVSDAIDLKLFPRVLTEFISSVVTAMVPTDTDEVNDFTIYVDLNKAKVTIKSDKDFEDNISNFETNALDYEYYEDEDNEEVISENEDGEPTYVLDINSLTSNKLRTIVIQDLIESVKHLLHKNDKDYYNYDPFLSSIAVDMLNSNIILKSDYSLYDSAKSFNNNGLPYSYYSTLSYE